MPVAPEVTQSSDWTVHDKMKYFPVFLHFKEFCIHLQKNFVGVNLMLIDLLLFYKQICIF